MQLRRDILVFYFMTSMTSFSTALMRSINVQGFASRRLSFPARLLFSSLGGGGDSNDDNSNNNNNNEFIKSYQLNGIGKKSRVEISTNTGHELVTDVPKKMGGTDSAPQPVETLLAAWMGCTQATAIFVGRQMKERVLIEKIEFDNIQAFRDERGALQLPIDKVPNVPSRLQRITGTIRIFSRSTTTTTSKGKGSFLSNEQIHLLKEQTEIRCPVANMMIASGCSIDVEWVDGNRVIES